MNNSILLHEKHYGCSKARGFIQGSLISVMETERTSVNNMEAILLKRNKMVQQRRMPCGKCPYTLGL